LLIFVAAWWQQGSDRIWRAWPPGIGRHRHPWDVSSARRGVTWSGLVHVLRQLICDTCPPPDCDRLEVCCPRDGATHGSAEIVALRGCMVMPSLHMPDEATRRGLAEA